jgi:hypothetical protein
MSLNKYRKFPRLLSYSQLGPNRLGRQRQASEMVQQPQAGCLAEVALYRPWSSGFSYPGNPVLYHAIHFYSSKCLIFGWIR